MKLSNTIRLGGDTVDVKPLTLENSLRLTLLLAPYIVSLEHKWPQIKAALESTNGQRPQLLQTVFTQLYSDMSFGPGVVTESLAICLDMDIAEVAQKATFKDLLEAWPVLDRINRFSELWTAVKGLGIVLRYKEIERSK